MEGTREDISRKTYKKEKSQERSKYRIQETHPEQERGKGKDDGEKESLDNGGAAGLGSDQVRGSRSEAVKDFFRETGRIPNLFQCMEGTFTYLEEFCGLSAKYIKINQIFKRKKMCRK